MVLIFDEGEIIVTVPHLDCEFFGRYCLGSYSRVEMHLSRLDLFFIAYCYLSSG